MNYKLFNRDMVFILLKQDSLLFAVHNLFYRNSKIIEIDRVD